MPARGPDPVIGALFNSWRFLERVDSIYWKCQCVCGQVKLLRSCHVKSGASTNCGCASVRGKVKHGQAGSCGSVGATKTYQAWRNIKQRCFNSKNDHYLLYGGRGISMSEEFSESFVAFYAELGEPPSPDMTVDRIDNNLGYVKGNLRWASKSVQQRNKRNSRLLTHNGVTKTLAEWCEDTGISKEVLSARLNRLGWSVAEALETEVRLDIRTYSKLKSNHSGG